MPAPVPPELSIIIVNWNSAHYLRACLSSIVQETRGITYEVIVVDNNSTTDDLDGLAGDFRSVRIIRNQSNVGFARANNIGFRNSTGEYLLFLNPDTYVEGPALTGMLRVMRERQDAGIVGCRLLNSDRTLQTSCVQRYPRVLNQALGADLLYNRFPRLSLWGLEPLLTAGQELVPVGVVSGACLMIRRSLFERVGLFSEDYFMFAEDVDLCYKVARANWSCYYFGNATVVHHGGGSTRQRPVSSWAVVAQCGAKLQFMRKTRSVAYGNLYRLAMATSAATRWLLLAGLAVTRSGRQRREYLRTAMTKWSAVFCWSLRPDVTLQRLIAGASNSFSES